jgi:hypothetical protein
MTQIFTPEHKAKLEEYLATHKKLTVVATWHTPTAST